MTKHGAGIAQAKVHQGMAVHIVQARALGLCHLQCKRGAPIGHPVQRHTKQQVRLGTIGQRARTGIARGKHGHFALQQGLGTGPVNSVAEFG